MQKRLPSRLGRSLSNSFVHQPVLLPFLYQTRTITKFLETQGSVKAIPVPSRGSRQDLIGSDAGTSSPASRPTRSTRKAQEAGSLTSDERAIFDRLFNEVASKTPGGTKTGSTAVLRRHRCGPLPFEDVQPLDVTQLQAPSRSAEELEKAQQLLASYPRPLRRNAALANGLYDVYETMHPQQRLEPKEGQKIAEIDHPESSQGLRSRAEMTPIDSPHLIITGDATEAGGSAYSAVSPGADLPSVVSAVPAVQAATSDIGAEPARRTRRTKKRTPKVAAAIQPESAALPLADLRTDSDIDEAYIERRVMLDEAAFHSQAAIFEVLDKHVFPLIPAGINQQASPAAIEIFPKLVLYAQTLIFRCSKDRTDSFILPRLRNFSRPDPLMQQPRVTGAMHYVLASSPAMYDLLLREKGGLLDMAWTRDQHARFADHFHAGRLRIWGSQLPKASRTADVRLWTSGRFGPAQYAGKVNWRRLATLLAELDEDAVPLEPITCSLCLPRGDEPSESAVGELPDLPSLLSLRANGQVDLLGTIDAIISAAAQRQTVGHVKLPNGEGHALTVTDDSTPKAREDHDQQLHPCTESGPHNPLARQSAAPLVLEKMKRAEDRRACQAVLRWRERAGRIAGRELVTDLVGPPGSGRHVDFEAVMHGAAPVRSRRAVGKAGAGSPDRVRPAESTAEIGERDTAGVRVSAMAPAVPALTEDLMNHQIREDEVAEHDQDQVGQQWEGDEEEDIGLVVGAVA